MFGLGPLELIIILVIILLLFGSTQLPKLARSIGGAAKELREGLDKGLEKEDKKSDSTSKKEDK